MKIAALVIITCPLVILSIGRGQVQEKVPASLKLRITGIAERGEQVIQMREGNPFDVATTIGSGDLTDSTVLHIKGKLGQITNGEIPVDVQIDWELAKPDNTIGFSVNGGPPAAGFQWYSKHLATKLLLKADGTKQPLGNWLPNVPASMSVYTDEK
ncbi:MAG: hypothetical protein JOZ57_01100 [Abitibacteriaceae bacterium]|nr:hypothetical protein [Abditibacteriaceae bacterium]